MNKSQLVSSIAELSGISLAKAEKALAAALGSISDALKQGGNVSLVGFGNFGVKKRAARKVKNPKTGQEMMINEAIVPFFKPGKNLKETLEAKDFN